MDLWYPVSMHTLPLGDLARYLIVPFSLPLRNAMSTENQDTQNTTPAGSRLGVGIALGAGIGTALGVALDNIAIGIALGTSIGIAIGASLDQQRKKAAEEASDN